MEDGHGNDAIRLSANNKTDTETPFLTGSSPSYKNTTQLKVNDSLREKLKDANYKSKFVHSLCLALATFMLGLLTAQNGPAFLDILLITGTDIESGAFFFTAGSIGYVIGSFLSGFAHGKINNHVLMTVSLLAAGSTVTLTPIFPYFWAVVGVRVATNTFCGCIDNLSSAEHLRLWRAEGKALLQFIHFTFAVGGMITPLYTEPFLAGTTVGNTSSNQNQSIYHYDIDMSANGPNNYSDVSANRSASDGRLPVEGVSNVRYAYLITGIMTCLSAIPFVVLFFTEKTQEKDTEDKPEDISPQRVLPKPLFVFMLIMLCLFYVLYCCVEDTFASFLMTFVVSEYDQVGKSRGAHITTFYWALFAAGRFMSIIVTRYLRAVQMMYLCSFLMVVAFTAFLVSAHFGAVVALTIFAGLAGVGMSALFPAGLSWTESELMKVTAGISSCIFISSSFGVMINPLFIGYLMEEVDNMWFCYIMVIQTLSTVFIFVFLLLFNRYYVNTKYGCYVSSDSEIDVVGEGTE